MSEPSFVLTQKTEEKKQSVVGSMLHALLRWLLKDVLLALLTFTVAALWAAYLAADAKWPREVAASLAVAYSTVWYLASAPWAVDGAGWWNIAVVAVSPIGACAIAGLRVWYVWPEPSEQSDDRVDTWHEVVS